MLVMVLDAYVDMLTWQRVSDKIEAGDYCPSVIYPDQGSPGSPGRYLPGHDTTIVWTSLDVIDATKHGVV